MTGNNYLLDTSIIIEVFQGNTSIADKINQQSGIYISSIVLGELLVGINRVTNKTKHVKKLTSFLNICTVLDIDTITASHYGNILAALFKKGTPIPTNDIWIASTVIQHGLTLVTSDKHFDHIEGLSFEKW